MVGIDTPLRLYELLALREEASQELLDMVESWEKAFRLYEDGDFLGAKNTFGLVYQKNQTDKVVKLYIDRCEKHLAAPPPPDKWDNGIDNLTEK